MRILVFCPTIKSPASATLDAIFRLKVDYCDLMFSKDNPYERPANLNVQMNYEKMRQMVLREGLWLAAVGLGIGFIAALAVTQLLKTQLFGVEAYDPVTFLLSGAILIAVALLACYLPARRAMRVDPMVALRYE